MKVLAIDIGGTKFSMAAFEGGRMVRRETRTTDKEGGREWMLEQFGAIARAWHREAPFDRCGIGFGGPVNFASQTVALSTHVAGWKDTRLAAHMETLLGVPAVMDNDANTGAAGEGESGAGKGCSPLFYMTLSTGIGGGIYADRKVWPGVDSWAGEIGHLTVRPDGPECLCGVRGCFERMCCGLWLERDYGNTAKELLADEAFVRRYVVDVGAGAEGGDHAAEPAPDRHRRRHRQGGGRPVRAAAGRAEEADHMVERRAHRRGAGRVGRRQRAVRRADTGEDTMTYLEKYRADLATAIDSIDLAKVSQAIEWLREARDAGRRIFVCGNGGSASTASHFACDMVKGASYNRPSRFRIMALTDQLPTITAYANDVSYDCVFAEHLKNFAEPGDVLMAISGSGNSPNVLRATEYANSVGCRTIALTGRDGGALGPMAQLNIQASVPHMGRIEDAHMIVCHMICYCFMEGAERAAAAR